jgi:hypothetical protein
LLSDGALYERAVEFVQQHELVADAQLNGLLQYAQEWHDLTRFVDRQRQRDWAQSSRTEHYGQFYNDLHEALRQLEREVARFVLAGLARREQQAQTAFYAGLLAREFVQHLVAEAQFAQTVRSGEQPAPAARRQGAQRRQR